MVNKESVEDLIISLFNDCSCSCSSMTGIDRQLTGPFFAGPWVIEEVQQGEGYRQHTVQLNRHNTAKQHRPNNTAK